MDDLQQYLGPAMLVLGIPAQFLRANKVADWKVIVAAVGACVIAWVLVNAQTAAAQPWNYTVLKMIAWIPTGMEKIAATAMGTSVLANMAVGTGVINKDHPMVPVTNNQSE